MVLNDEQNDRFFDTMDALLYYVNERFHVVEGFTLDGAGPLDDVKSSLVARTLWDNVEIIDDFVRDFAHRMPQDCLDLAASWKYALPGFYTLVRYQSGRAMLMGDAGVFSVCGVTYELEQEIGPAPAYVETVLLPFDDLIIYDGFLQAYDTDRAASEPRKIQDEFENRCANGIALTGADFIRQAQAYLAARRDQELEALLEDVARESARGEEQIPAGFHRGKLAGLGPVERDQRIFEEFGKLYKKKHLSVREFDKRVRKHEPVRALDDCLMLMTKAELDMVASALGMGSLYRLRKAEMVAEISAELKRTPLALELLLTMTADANYELLRKLSTSGDVVFGTADIPKHENEWPIEPYVFMFKGADGYTVLVPDEFASLFQAVDFERIDRVRRQHKQAFSCVEACAVIYGVISVADAYDQYRSLVSEVLSHEDFETLLQMVSSLGNASFGLWNCDSTEYLVHYTLLPDFVAQEFAQQQSQAISGLYRDRETGEFSFDPYNRAMSRFRSDLQSELESLEQYKRSLLEAQQNMPIKPLTRSLLENDVISELLDNPNAVRLRAFLDERIPDGEDDLSFADRAVESLVFSAIESGSLQEMFASVMDMGLEGCSEDEKRLPVLVTNLYNAMPSWENNGWSPQELYEQVTGRKMFYNDDGSVMIVGADDLCPCGSGKKYRDCCGR